MTEIRTNLETEMPDGLKGWRRKRLTQVLTTMLTAASVGVLLGVGAPAHAQKPSDFIKDVIIIMQENRSFDHYFGTFPGADGIPMVGAIPTVCAPDPLTSRCVQPYHDPRLVTGGGPHGSENALADIDGGRMDGFLQQAESSNYACAITEQCLASPIDVMGYHDSREIPNYWKYAQNFVLADHMFEPITSKSMASHLFAVSEWSAICSSRTDPMSCRNAMRQPAAPNYGQPVYVWTDLTYLLHKKQVRWAYYVVEGTEPDCEDPTVLSCVPGQQTAAVPNIWNPLPAFSTVIDDNEVGNVQTVANFYTMAANGTLPAVSWVIPSNPVSDHPIASIADGQAFVTSLVNAVMNGPQWDSSAIFIAWDDWGGFYDHVVPPKVDQNGYGLRVPAILVSPYAKTSFIDHQTLSFDAYVKFIEDLFLDGQRLDPATDGRPDPRPTVREDVKILGDLTKEFDFNQKPRPPMILKPYP